MLIFYLVLLQVSILKNKLKYEEFEIYFKQRKELEEKKRRLENQAKLVSSYKAVISEDAVFYKVLDKINSFKEFYLSLEENRIQIA